MPTKNTSPEPVAWVEKYRPKTLSEVIGSDKAKEELLNWAKGWVEGNPATNAVILYGSAGVGKTSAAHALAHDFGWDVIELNASDQRTAGIIKRVAGAASASSGLFEDRLRLIILDEADNIHGTADFGGSREILKIIRNTHNPIILTANDLYGISKAVKAECGTIQFRALRKITIQAQLRRICKKEGIACDELLLKEIAEGKSDLRSAINDLQAIAEGKDRITREDLVTGGRDKRESIFNLLSSIFRGGDMEDIYKSSYRLDETPDTLIHWIDENMPRQLTGESLVYGMDHLSRSDRFLGRVKRRQNYKFWRYASFLMICGTVQAISKSAKDTRTFVKYQPPSHFRRLSQSKGRRKREIQLGLKIAKTTHTSEEYSRRRLIPLLKLIFKDTDDAAAMTGRLGLDEDDVLLIIGGRATKRAGEIVKLSDILSKSASTKNEIPDSPIPAPTAVSTEGKQDKPKKSGQKTLFEFG
ncbi:MAG: replication factor C large subunit [Candidatus Syntropharchaeales archaeon]